MLSVPFALVGGIWLMWALDYNLSVAVGFIALAGVAAETGVVMLIYLDHAWAARFARCREDGRAPQADDLVAAPMVGGMVSSTVLTLVVIPARYALVKQWAWRRGAAAPG